MEKAQFDVYSKIDPEAEIRVAFDQTSPNWHYDQEVLHLFVRHNMNFLRDKLLVQGYLFVNDVLDCLGLPRTSEGQLLGWSNFGEKMDFSFTSGDEGGWIILKNAQFIWHTI